MNETTRELLCGGLGGAVGVFVGQPFDFVKVRLQAGSTLGRVSYSGALDCVLKTVRREGVLGMYRGATPPILNSFVLNAIMFAGYGHGSRFSLSKAAAWWTAAARQISLLGQTTAGCWVGLRTQAESPSHSGLHAGPRGHRRDVPMLGYPHDPQHPGDYSRAKASPRPLARTAWSKCPPWQCPSSPPVPPQGAPGGSGQLGTPRVRASYWAPSHRLGGSSELSCLRSRRFHWL